MSLDLQSSQDRLWNPFFHPCSQYLRIVHPAQRNASRKVNFIVVNSHQGQWDMDRLIFKNLILNLLKNLCRWSYLDYLGDYLLLSMIKLLDPYISDLHEVFGLPSFCRRQPWFVMYSCNRSDISGIPGTSRVACRVYLSTGNKWLRLWNFHIEVL